jgi:hypothetical protein
LGNDAARSIRAMTRRVTGGLEYVCDWAADPPTIRRQTRFYFHEFDNNELNSINYQVNRLLREAASLNSIIDSCFSIINLWISIIKLKNSIIKDW